nr:probable 26S proteasome non-ATPase regulatory subunit 3 [Tanacetum cinerariifolium]
MSRCFPYNQNGATIEALINPIKLQKEKSEKSKAKAEKKEKKRAKKEQKQKEKEKRKVEEKRTVQKSSTVDSTKALIKTLELTKTSELTIEQRERSDLTEERGQPISSQQSYSSDSTQNTQNSNKRKRDDAVLPDASGGHGKQTKIQLLKKPRGPESGVDPSLSNVGRVETRVRASTSVQVPGVAGRNMVAINGSTSVLTTSGRENVSPQARQFSQITSGPSTEIPRTKVNELKRQSVGMKPIAPVSPKKTEVLPILSQSRQNGVKLGQFSRQQGPRFGGRQGPPSSATTAVPRSHVECEIPRPSLNVQTGPTVSRRIHAQGPRFVGQQQAGVPKMPTSHLQRENISNVSVLGKRSTDEMTAPSVNGLPRSGMGVSGSGVPQKACPTRSERGKEVPVGEVQQKAGPTRLEKKMKKNSEYEKLIGSWVPPVMAPCGGGGGEDEDWLSKKGKTVKSCSKDVDTCELAAPLLWQPCARFLVDADVYAMPYTVDKMFYLYEWLLEYTCRQLISSFQFKPLQRKPQVKMITCMNLLTTQEFLKMVLILWELDLKFNLISKSLDKDDAEEMSGDEGDEDEEEEDEEEEQDEDGDDENNDLENNDDLPHPDTDQDDHEIDEDDFDEEMIEEEGEDDEKEADGGVILGLGEELNGINVLDHIEVFGRDHGFSNDALHVMPVEFFGSRRQGHTTSIYNLLGRAGDTSAPSQHPLLVEPSSSRPVLSRQAGNSHDGFISPAPDTDTTVDAQTQDGTDQLQASSEMVPEPITENISNNESVPTVDESRQGTGATVGQAQSVPMQSEHNSALRDVEAASVKRAVKASIGIVMPGSLCWEVEIDIREAVKTESELVYTPKEDDENDIKNTEAKACSSASIARLKNLNRRTVDVLASRLYFYYSLSYELTDSLFEIRGNLLALHRVATLRHDELGQETLLNLLLRNYLHYNLYDQAEKLRSKVPRCEAHSNQQFCRYLFYLGKIRTIQLEYTDAKESLLQAARKAPVAALGFRVQCNKWAVIVRLLLGEIPKRTVFMQKGMEKALRPYFELTNVSVVKKTQIIERENKQGPVDSRTRRRNASLGNTASVRRIEASLHSVTEVSESPKQEAEEGDAAQDTQHDTGSASAQIDPAYLDALPEELRDEVLSGRQGLATQPSNTEPQNGGEIDPEFLAAIPPDIRAEVLAQQHAQGVQRSQELDGQPVEMDNVSIIATFPSEIREEVLLTSLDAILSNLTPAVVAEANMRGESSRRGEGIGSSLDTRRSRLVSEMLGKEDEVVEESSSVGGGNDSVRGIGSVSGGRKVYWRSASWSSSHVPLPPLVAVQQIKNASMRNYFRSDLTEEHGQPISSQQPSYSFDSTQNTQNSNKRKRDDAVLPDGLGGHGKQIMVRLLKKPRGPEPGVDPSLSNVGGVETHVSALNSVQARQFSQIMSGPSSEIPRTKVNELQRQRVGMKPIAPRSVRAVPPNHLKHEVPSSHFKKTEVLPVLSQSRQNDVKLGQFSRQQQPTSSEGRPVVPQGKRSIAEMTAPSVNGPARSEMGVSVSGVPQKAGPTRLEKKMMKKNSKYEKLIGSWVPPVMTPYGVGGSEDEDWLSKKGKTVKSCSKDVDTCELAAPSLWHPCARFLVDADVYEMPYTLQKEKSAKSKAKAERKEEKRAKKEEKQKEKEKRKGEEKRTSREPEPGVDPALSNVGGVETPVRALNSVQVPGVAGRNMVTSNGRTSVLTTSGRENVAPQARQSSQIMSGPSTEVSRAKVNELQRQRVGMKPIAPSSVRPVPPNHLKHEVPSSHFKKTEVLPVLSQSRQNNVKLGQFSRQQQPTSSQGRPVVPQGRLVNDVLSSSLNVSNAPSVTRRIDVQGPRYGGQQVARSSGTAAVPQSYVEPEIPRPIDVQGPHYVGQQRAGIPKMPTSHLQHENISKASVLGKRSIAEMTVPSVNGPARSEMGVLLSRVPRKVGPPRSAKGKEGAVGEVPQKAGPTRLEKKMMKKNSKYEKLIGSWVPSVMAPCGGGGGEDEDWLSKKVKTVKSCSKDVDTCELAAPSLWQPCARFLVDADVYAMPYTVPF